MHTCDHVEVTGPTAVQQFRVATFNVLTPLLADWPARRRVVAAQIEEARPDIIALQEVDAGPDRDEALHALLGPGWHAAWHSHTTPDGIGLVLASRWPFGEIREHGLGVTDRAAAVSWSAVVLAEVLAPAPLGPVTIAHHKPVFPFDYEHERELQAVEAARFIRSEIPSPDEHVILLGDFDAAPDSAGIRFLTGHQSLSGMSVCYHDVWEAINPGDPGHTFSPQNPLVAAGDMFTAAGRRIDYVMVRGASFGPTLQARSAERFGVAGVDGVQASDHYGVVAELEVPPRLPGQWG